MWKRLLLFVFVISLGACNGDSDDTQEPDPAEPAAQETPTLALNVDLSLWHSYTGATLGGIQAVVNGFKEQYGQVDITLEYHVPDDFLSDFETALRQGAGPDILLVEQTSIPLLVEKRFLFPLDDATAQRVPAPFLESLSYDNQIWGIPVAADVLIMYTTNEPPQTLDELMQRDAVLWPGLDGTIGLYLATAPFVVNRDGQILLSELALTQYVDLYRELDENLTFSDDYAAFVNGDADVWIAYASAYPELADALGDQLQVARLPDVEQAQWQPMIKLEPLVISQNATDNAIQATYLFFSYFMLPETQQQFAEVSGQTPLVVQDPNDLDAIARPVWEQMNRAQPRPLHPVYGDIVAPRLTQLLADAAQTDIPTDELVGDFLPDLWSAIATSE